MDLTPYVEELRRQVEVAADAAGDDARAVAERLLAPLESAIRLTLLDALSAAADEITRELAPGSVDLRLRGGQPDFVVTPPPSDEHTGHTGGGATDDPDPSMSGDADEGATLRINFRLPENLKARIEAAAERDGLSVNSWLVRSTWAAVQTQGRDADRRGGRRDNWGRQRHTGWVR